MNIHPARYPDEPFRAYKLPRARKAEAGRES